MAYLRLRLMRADDSILDGTDLNRPHADIEIPTLYTDAGHEGPV